MTVDELSNDINVLTPTDKRDLISRLSASVYNIDEMKPTVQRKPQEKQIVHYAAKKNLKHSD